MSKVLEIAMAIDAVENNSASALYVVGVDILSSLKITVESQGEHCNKISENMNTKGWGGRKIVILSQMVEVFNKKFGELGSDSFVKACGTLGGFSYMQSLSGKIKKLTKNELVALCNGDTNPLENNTPTDAQSTAHKIDTIGKTAIALAMLSMPKWAQDTARVATATKNLWNKEGKIIVPMLTRENFELLPAEAQELYSKLGVEFLDA
mgnify:FL=1|tara:strand:+ start:3038 stop:3661 length:624 start_codon:yes stop_codon:yes gene_type:complete